MSFQNIDEISKDNSDLPPYDLTLNYTLIELVQILNDIDGLNSIINFFTSYFYTVTRHIKGIVGIKYVEGGNKLWKAKWSREARNKFYWIGTTSKTKVIELRGCLQRSIEVLTTLHIKMNLTTQDVSLKSIDIFDDIQQKILTSFRKDNCAIDCILSDKIDGSTIIVTIMPAKHEGFNIIKQLLKEGDSFNQELLKCQKDTDPLVYISTQGTILITEEMEDYFVTSIMELFGFKNATMEDWKFIAPLFIEKILNYYNMQNPNDLDYMSLFFEAYCRNRTTINGKLHTELTINYFENGFSLIGMQYKNFIPHFDLKEYFFQHPRYLNISNTLEVYNLMKNLDDVVNGIMKIEDFFTKYKFNNNKSNILHPEGFIMYTKTPNGYDSSKLKTPIYYKCHNINVANISRLLKEPLECRKYYKSIDVIQINYNFICKNLHQLVKLTNQILVKQIYIGSPLYNLQTDRAKERFVSYINNPNDSNYEIVYKILCNTANSSDELSKIFMPIFNSLYSTQNPKLIKTMCQLLIKAQVYKPDVNKNIDYMIANVDEILTQLYDDIIGAKLTYKFALENKLFEPKN